MPLTRIPSGISSCAKVEVAWPMADFEYMYGKVLPDLAGSFVQPFMLLVMMICGTNLAPPGLFFHFSRRGRKANVNQ